MKRVSSQLSLIIGIILIGCMFRFTVASLGYTYDMESYRIVGEIVSRGGNVYQETVRYNYGPIWFSILGIIYTVASLFSNSFLVFRFAIVALLTIIDTGIGIILWKRYSLAIAFLFLLNPLSIIITGYYSQFDNFALLLGICSVLLFEKSKSSKLDKFFISGLVLLGISLAVKHIFFLLPLWLATRDMSWRKRILILVVPFSIFGIGFIPFLDKGFNGIKHNVFLYTSFNNGPLWQIIIPDVLKRYIIKEFLFVGALGIGAFIFRRHTFLDQLLWYSSTMVIFSFAIAEQYFAIVLPFIAIYTNIFFLGFIVIQTAFFVMVMNDGYLLINSVLLDRSRFGFSWQVVLLFFGYLFAMYRLYYPKYRLRHGLIIASTAIVLLYGGVLLPSYLEDKRITPIMQAINSGDFELANDLYHNIEVNPPFAGSRFWNKLKTVRFNIEFYRQYRHALDGFLDQSLQRDWKAIDKSLEVIPKAFPDKDQVIVIKEYAQQQYDK